MDRTAYIHTWCRHCSTTHSIPLRLLANWAPMLNSSDDCFLKLRESYGTGKVPRPPFTPSEVFQRESRECVIKGCDEPSRNDFPDLGMGGLGLCEVHDFELRDRLGSLRRIAGLARSNDRSGSFYIAKATPTDHPFDGQTELVKIGSSSDVPSRMKALRAHLLATGPGGRELEGFLQRRFWSDWVSGEWYRSSSAILAFVEERQRQMKALPVSLIAIRGDEVLHVENMTGGIACGASARRGQRYRREERATLPAVSCAACVQRMQERTPLPQAS